MWKRIKPELRRYFKNLLIALDQLGNAVLAGYPDETFSSRAYRKAQAGQWFWRAVTWVIDRVFFWQKGHCQASYDFELTRRHSPGEFTNANG